ncbi:MAG: hypothetical protein IJX05_06010 [Clostridia bacterium]|nr:hypothetical protein [Clostridia bacterium]
MIAWLLSVAGVGILGVIVSHLTAGTRLKKTVKVACTYVFILAVIFPLPSLISDGVSGESCGGIFDGEIEYNQDVLDVTDGAYFEIVATSLESVLSESGYVCDCKIKGTMSGEKARIENVTVNVKGEFADSVVAGSEIRKLVSEYLEISESEVKVNFE